MACNYPITAINNAELYQNHVQFPCQALSTNQSLISKHPDTNEVNIILTVSASILLTDLSSATTLIIVLVGVYLPIVEALSRIRMGVSSPEPTPHPGDRSTVPHSGESPRKVPVKEDSVPLEIR